MIKKIIICLTSIFLLTACDPNHDFTKVCSQTVDSLNYKEKTITTINYNNKDEVTQVVVEKKYDVTDKDVLDLVKESAVKYNESVKDKKGIKVEATEEKGKYNLIYTINPKVVEQNILDNFEIKTNSIKYFNYLKKNNVECS